MPDDQSLLPDAHEPQQPLPPAPFSGQTPDDASVNIPPAQPVAAQPTSARRRTSPWLIAGLAAAVLIGGAAIGARQAGAANFGGNAAVATATGTTQPEQRDHMRGRNILTVTDVSGTTLNGKDRSGTAVKVTTDAKTKILKGGQTIKLTDLKSGDQVAIKGTKNSDGSITATAIMVILPSVHGQVSAINGSTLTITTRDNLTATVKVTSNTTYRLGTSTGSLADIKVGSEIAAQGTKASDGSLTADVVMVRVPRAAGQITQISGNTITIKDYKQQSVAIQVTSTTTYTNPMTKATLKLTDLKVGDFILAEGSVGATATNFTATAILQVPAGFGHGPGKHDGPPAGTGTPATGTTGYFPGPGFDDPGQ